MAEEVNDSGDDGGGWAIITRAPTAGGVEPPGRCSLPELASPLIEALALYWEQRRDERPFPARTDLDPLHIPALLPDLVLFDVLAPPGSYRIRLFGTRLSGANRSDLTGRALENCGLGDGYAGFRRLFDGVCIDRAPAFFESGFHWRRQLYRRFRMGVFPLGVTPERVDMLLGGVDMLAS